MGDKKNRTRFSIVLDESNPLHIQAAELLNKQKYRGKAQYIVNAVLHYEDCDISADTQSPVRFDEKAVEAVVMRILCENVEIIADKPTVSAPTAQVQKPLLTIEEINFDDAMEALGEDGFNVVAGALSMFRNNVRQ